MTIVVAFVFVSLLLGCKASSGEFDAPFDSECHSVSLLQVGMQVSGKDDHSAIQAHIHTATPSDVKPISVRPGIHNGVKDVVKFGIRLKKWYGIESVAGTASMDAVITLRWNDDRTLKLIPSNASSVTLPARDAKTQMWLPNIAVTNAAHHGIDVTSSSVKIAKGGQVTKVLRLLLTLKMSLDTRNFPFDSQTVSIKLASTTYMKDELEFEPLQNASLWGASTNLFDNSNWELNGAEMQSIVEDDGSLKKSRGLLNLKVKRQVAQYQSAIFIPSLVFLIMTWSAFWLPLEGPYVMPRVAVNAFALLCQVSLNRGANDMVPATGKAVWMLKYLELCIELQFTLMLVNVLVLAIERRPGGSELALKLDSRIIWAFPASCAVNIAVLCLGRFCLSQALVVVTLIGYMGYLSWEYHKHHTKDPQFIRRRMTLGFSAPQP